VHFAPVSFGNGSEQGGCMAEDQSKALLSDGELLRAARTDADAFVALAERLVLIKRQVESRMRSANIKASAAELTEQVLLATLSRDSLPKRLGGMVWNALGTAWRWRPVQDTIASGRRALTSLLDRGLVESITLALAVRVGAQRLQRKGDVIPSSPKLEKARQFVERLPPRHRDLLQRVLLLGETVEKAGSRLGLSKDEANALYKEAHRGMQGLLAPASASHPLAGPAIHPAGRRLLCAWVGERVGQPATPLRVGESYCFNFKIGQPEVIAPPPSEGPARTTPSAEQLETEWLVMSTDIELAQIKDSDVKVVHDHDDKSHFWSARFTLLVPDEGDSLVQPLRIRPLVVPRSRMDVLVYARHETHQELYRQFTVDLSVTEH
jgi:hypothetical protein